MSYDGSKLDDGKYYLALDPATKSDHRWGYIAVDLREDEVSKEDPLNVAIKASLGNDGKTYWSSATFDKMTEVVVGQLKGADAEYKMEDGASALPDYIEVIATATFGKYSGAAVTSTYAASQG